MRQMASIAAGAAVVLLSVSAALAQPEPEQPPPDGGGEKPPDTPQVPPKQITDKDLATAQQEDSRPWAKGVSVDRQRKALALFNEANGMLRDALFPRAAEKYREALTHWDHPAIHYNLALALVNLDQPVEMHAELEQALVHGPSPLGEDKYARAKDFKVLVEKQLATVEYTVTIPGAILLFDGKEVLTGPGTWSSRVRAGEHNVAARAEGYAPTQLNPKLLGGDVQRLELKLFTDKELTREKTRMPKFVPYSVLGAGVVAIGVGALLHTSAKSGLEDYDQAIADCAATDPSGGCSARTPAMLDMKSSAESKQNFAAVAYTVGGVAVATGVVLVILNRPQSYRIDPLKAELNAGTTVTPVLGPDMAGFAAVGRF